jgi:hypothetical protein
MNQESTVNNKDNISISENSKVDDAVNEAAEQLAILLWETWLCKKNNRNKENRIKHCPNQPLKGS